MANKKKTAKTGNASGSDRGLANRKPSGKRKRSPKKKIKKSFLSGPVLTAFIAGLLLASVCFYSIYTLQNKKNTVVSVPSKAITKKSVSPEALAGSKKTASEVNKALAELQDLPFEENEPESLEEQARQIDYAIIQSGWTQGLPDSHMRLVGEESRKKKEEAYSFRLLDILPGGTGKEYIQTLKNSLAIWAPAAVLNNKGNNRLSITVKGVETHRLSLYTGASVFPDTTTLSLPKKISTLGSERRKPGEPALMVIVIDDLGASHSAVNRLLELQFPVSFAFWPYGDVTYQGATKAHAAGKEILIHMPMEPLGYPRVKPGPGVLLSTMKEEEIIQGLANAFLKVPFATGLNNHMGSRFTQHRDKIALVLQELKSHGYFMLDSVTHGRSVFYEEASRYGIKRYQRNIFLDTQATQSHVLQQLKKTESIALLTGHAVAIGHPLPATLAALEKWQGMRNKEVRLVRLVDLPAK